MKKICLILLALAGPISMNSQTDQIPQTAFAKMYLPVWEEAVEHCLAVAEAMPEEKYDYRPTEISKTFAEQMVHIGAATKLLTQRYVEGLNVKPNTPEAATLQKAEIIDFLKTNFNYTKNVLIEIDQAKLDESCKMYHSKNVVSRAFAMFYVQDHMANHRAKANLYIRLNGIEPPEYTW